MRPKVLPFLIASVVIQFGSGQIDNFSTKTNAVTLDNPRQNENQQPIILGSQQTKFIEPIIESDPHSAYLTETETVEIYLNSITNTLSIALPRSSFDFCLYSLTGKPVVEESGLDSHATLDVSDLVPGIYTVKLTTGKNTYEKRIVIQK